MKRVEKTSNDGLIILEQRIEASASGAVLQLPLTAEQRLVFRGRRQTRCGRVVLLQLPRCGVLRPGEQLTDAAQSLRVEVTAAPEALLKVMADSPLALLQAAYHLGNRHVALEVHDRELLLLNDAVLSRMLEGRGLRLTRCMGPFTPEAGAYGEHQHR